MLLSQLDVLRMNQIKSIIWQQARERCDLEFEAIWAEDMHRYIVTGERRLQIQEEMSDILNARPATLC